MLKHQVIKAAVLFASTAITGVAIADSNNMEVNDAVNTLTEVVQDTAALAAANAKLAADPLLTPFQISVTMDGNTANLSGQVDTDMQFEKAVYLTSSVNGVDDVNADNLKVKNSEQPMEDLLITAKIKGALIKGAIFDEKKVDYWPFDIETKDGVVYIQGKADSPTVKENVLKIIYNVNGVKNVEENITIRDGEDGSDL